MKEKGRCTLKGKDSKPRKAGKQKIFVSIQLHVRICRIKNGLAMWKITFLTIGMPVKGGLLQAAFATAKFHYITAWEAHP